MRIDFIKNYMTTHKAPSLPYTYWDKPYNCDFKISEYRKFKLFDRVKTTDGDPARIIGSTYPKVGFLGTTIIFFLSIRKRLFLMKNMRIT